MPDLVCNFQSVLMRSSQPLVGSTNKRCKEDERLLNSVLGIGKRGFIIDTRASNSKVFWLYLLLLQVQLRFIYKVIFSFQSRNGGYELQAHYPQWRRLPKPIERHHVLLDSLSKIVEGI